MNAREIRMFLLKLPKPASVRVSGDNVETQTLNSAKNAMRCAETIEALDVDLVECLDAKGALIRAMRLSDDEEGQRAAIPAVLSADPETARLTHFANLLAHAYEHSTDIAFQKLVEIVERMGDRSDAIEQRLERAEARARRLADEQIEDAFERAEELAETKVAEAAANGGLGDQIVTSFLAGKLQGGAAALKPNGTKGPG